VAKHVVKNLPQDFRGLKVRLQAVSGKRHCPTGLAGLPRGSLFDGIFPFPAKTGVDVMITIFCNFSQISAKKLAFF
jgi:hypothetical protein